MDKKDVTAMSTLLDEKRILIDLNIGYYRRARHMTQIELAEALSISSNYLSQIERGCKTLSLDKLLQLAEILQIDEKEISRFQQIDHLCLIFFASKGLSHGRRPSIKTHKL